MRFITDTYAIKLYDHNRVVLTNQHSRTTPAYLLEFVEYVIAQTRLFANVVGGNSSGRRKASEGTGRSSDDAGHPVVDSPGRRRRRGAGGRVTRGERTAVRKS